MYSIGTQRKFWNFPSLDELNTLREEAHERFIKSHSDMASVCLTFEEENIIRRGYEEKLREFCTKFQPPLTHIATGTAMMFFKRLFLNHSVMEVPIEDYMHTCLFLACKTIEFNISSRQYVSNLEVENRSWEDVARDIYSLEMDLMEKLRYQLVVHTPHRPVEGFVVDIKARCPEVDADRLRPGIAHFLYRSLLSDVLFIYPPSQVALSACITSATNLGMNMALDSFIANKLFANASYEVSRAMISQLQKIKQIVRSVREVDREEFSVVDAKLADCYRAMNNEPKCWRWKLPEPIELDMELVEGGTFDDDDDDDDD